MGQQFANLVDVHYWLLIGVVNGCLDFVLADLATHLAGELVIDGVSRTGGDDATLDGLADKCHIADDVEQLMACALVFPYQWLVLNVTQLGSVAVFYAQHVGQRVQTLLCGLSLVDDDSVVQVATLDKVGLQQRFNIANEDEGACGSYLGGEVLHVVECGKL